ncbi:MAG TPA: HAMP domain-containing sensor histidine kinase [Rhizomicrobium sp.]|jgi:two-component system cell cycle sensor histidine kinase PleC|nr:HAMP domain-containing sensor histidine kinase [Rhizomicrobium sp.]
MLGRRASAQQRPSLLTEYSVTLGEMTLRRKTELALVASRIESELANRAKTAFLGTMSHELRTPLNAIIGFSNLIQTIAGDEKAIEKSVEYAGHISQAGSRLLETIAAILDISKIESGALKLNLDLQSIADPIDDAVYDTEKMFAERLQELEVRTAPDLPNLNIDRPRIAQIVRNLLSNASKYSDAGARIFLITQKTETGVSIAVVDHGAGMNPEQLAVAMRTFGQVQSHMTREHEGVGLGLPLARALALAHGGDLLLESEVGKGTIALLTLNDNLPKEPAA